MFHRLIASVVTLVLALQTDGCGLLIYPERKGQKSGSIDPGVAILDAAGLLVFVVPGLIAFGVDFITGCIYQPGGRRAATLLLGLRCGQPAAEVQKALFEHHILAGTSADPEVLRIMPPLNFSKAEADLLLSVLSKVLSA